MSTVAESGQYSIAGFLFQLLGSGIEQLKILEGLPSVSQIPDEIVVIECSGQDGLRLPTKSGTEKPVFGQYKFTSKSSDIKPSEIRKILEAFRKSVLSWNSSGKPTDFSFELVTNRELSKQAKKFFDTSNKPAHSQLVDYLKNTKKKDKTTGQRPAVPNVNLLATICENTKYIFKTNQSLKKDAVAFCREFGMNEVEIKTGLQKMYGLLCETAQSEFRVINQSDFLQALIGFPNPMRLLSQRSFEKRIQKAKSFKDSETHSQEQTIVRRVSQDIASSILTNPFVVVVGDGGHGKSVATADALLQCLKSKSPNFGLVVRGAVANKQEIMKTIATWRGLANHQDSDDWGRSLERLSVSDRAKPLLVVFVDAIDEKKDGSRVLPFETTEFLSELKASSEEQMQKNAEFDVTVVVSCRNSSELTNLGRGHEFNSDAKITVGHFDDDELERAMKEFKLERVIQNRISTHLMLRKTNPKRLTRKTGSIMPNTISALRLPLVWRFFCELSVTDQNKFLDSDITTHKSLISKFQAWILRKARIRLPDLGDAEFENTLNAVANKSSEFGMSVTYSKQEVWTNPCTACGCSPNRSDEIYQECVTAGIIVETETGFRGTWRWKLPWFCEGFMDFEVTNE